MKTTLYINSADSHHLSVAVEREGKRWEKNVNAHHKSSQTLLPAIYELLTEQHLTTGDITEIEVFTGPGSYTGLRVGATIASALSALLGIPINGQTPGTVPKIHYGEDVWKLEDLSSR
jgi:tRNA threonylcarbamoyladenosine biosynthesis protein TsaB